MTDHEPDKMLDCYRWVFAIVVAILVIAFLIWWLYDTF